MGASGKKLNNPVWRLDRMLEGLHQRVARELSIARETIAHASTKGGASERVWIRLFETYLPERYRTGSATVVDSEGNFSDQIDIVIYDRQYSPLIFEFEGAAVVPVEAVYAVFESKQAIEGRFVKYAQEKVESVRRLKRTSVPVPTINGKHAKAPHRILGGLLTLDANYRGSLNSVMEEHLKAGRGDQRLDLGCVATQGTFGCGGASSFKTTLDDKAATSFLLELLSRLQACGTAPAIDYRQYARWLKAGDGKAGGRERAIGNGEVRTWGVRAEELSK